MGLERGREKGMKKGTKKRSYENGRGYKVRENKRKDIEGVLLKKKKKNMHKEL